MTIRRASPEVRTHDVEAARAFYTGLGFDVVMDEGSFLLFASPTNPDVQVALNADPHDGPVLPPGFAVDVETGDAVDAAHERAVAEGRVIVEPLTTKPWGIRRFSMLDPSGTKVTVLAHV